ncbi:MAG: hypothetical protein ACREUX_11660 [Burkholderiales bacterium]
MQAGPDSAGSLIPAHAYHTPSATPHRQRHIGNASRDKVACRIYQSRWNIAASSCGRAANGFMPQSGKWYRRIDPTLAVDRVA